MINLGSKRYYVFFVLKFTVWFGFLPKDDMKNLEELLSRLWHSPSCYRCSQWLNWSDGHDELPVEKEGMVGNKLLTIIIFISSKSQCLWRQGARKEGNC